MPTLDEHAAYITAVQHACRKARDSRKKIDLEKAGALLNSDRYDGLPPGVQVDLAAAFAAAMVAQTGVFS